MVIPWLHIFLQILWVYVVDPKVQPIYNNSKPRVLILTDISSLTQDKGEPDDGQSLIRLMLYANEFDIEGLIATSNLEHGQTVRTDLIKKVIEAYGKVRQQLVLHDRRYPSEADLSKTIFGGQPIAGREIAYQKSI
ncbi:MAG TPA: nucleoside hydrolase-like domain-containing protein, partial [Flavitalea sp.]|nr:nucleoside hydrolase-like domain-containing protein [Flavitalea sp.]